ncbi:3-hydroxyacyl-CoA dehydrogenase family protein [Sphingosinicella xenopeptidilytica]|uniref:3-hydroxyacyl-CoA dehydrogenase family protein n=1 Tax=Sphingosinicella xenopeptidilytica TaxID=364098 RepID=A0ABW3C3S5_SPHXN
MGAGLMGAEIALVQALAGKSVLLLDRDEGALTRAVTRIAGLLEKGVARGFYDAALAESTPARIRATVDIADFKACEIATEAVFEDLEVKADILQRLDETLPVGAMIATNTSTIPISVLASRVSEARRPHVIGMHYFSPVSRMKLVEVIPAFDTAEETVKAAYALAESTGKVPIRVKDVAGFAVNRVLHVFLIEAVRLVEEEVISVDDLNTACKLGLGHPLGPFELMDATTSSLCLTAQEIMFDAYGERFRPRPLLKTRVAAGLVGGKGRKGWS